MLLGKPSPDFNTKKNVFVSYTMVYMGTKNILKRIIFQIMP